MYFATHGSFRESQFLPKHSFLHFFLKIEPSEAIHQLKELPPSSRKAILTKGVVNILPNPLKNMLLPQSDQFLEESDNTSPEIEQASQYIQSQADREENSGSDLLSNENTVTETLLVLDPPKIRSSNQNGYPNRIAQVSTDDDCLVNHNFTLSKQLELKKDLPSFVDVNPIRTHLDYYNAPRGLKTHLHLERRNKGKSVEPRVTPKLRKMFIHEMDSDCKTEIISSNKAIDDKPRLKIELSETWDKLELFASKRREKLLMRQKNGADNAHKKIELKGSLQTLHNIVTIFSKGNIMNKLEDKTLLKVFLISSLILLVQATISKKTRLWCYHTFHILMYITGFALSTGSLGLLLIKLRKKHREWKESQQSSQSNLELREKQE